MQSESANKFHDFYQTPSSAHLQFPSPRLVFAVKCDQLPCDLANVFFLPNKPQNGTISLLLNVMSSCCCVFFWLNKPKTTQFQWSDDLAHAKRCRLPKERERKKKKKSATSPIPRQTENLKILNPKPKCIGFKKKKKNPHTNRKNHQPSSTAAAPPSHSTPATLLDQLVCLSLSLSLSLKTPLL